jgi:predicted DsbA family dithiol-disulfide isomerase
MEREQPLRVEIWADLVCPWCYIGKRRFERALASFPHRERVDVVHRSFQLDPHSPPGVTRSREEMLKAKYGWSDSQLQEIDARMKSTAAAEGLDYHLEGGVTGNTLDAHRVVHLAAARGLQDAVVERLYRAHFVEQRSLFDHESLIGLAAEAGLDATDVRHVVEGTDFAERVADDVNTARSLGASGVPFFVIDNRYAVSGAQSSDVFGQALARAWEHDVPVQR